LYNEELNILERLLKHYYGDQIEEDEMDGTCSTDGRDEKCI